MQDELITKLWHTNRKCFIEQFSTLQSINSEGQYEHTYFEYNSNTQELERLSSCQIEELKCSGVRDKNKNLIYKGDIVKIRDFNALGYSRENIGTVDYLYAEHYPAFYVMTTLGDAKDFTHDMEVIGNIYENPELLDGRS